MKFGCRIVINTENYFKFNNLCDNDVVDDISRPLAAILTENLISNSPCILV